MKIQKYSYAIFCFLILALAFSGCGYRSEPCFYQEQPFDIYEEYVPMLPPVQTTPEPVYQPRSQPVAVPLPAKETPAKATTKEQKPLIVIDAGHGGKDPGAQSQKGTKYQEKSLTLTTALMTSKYLQKMGYRTVLTRKDDVFISLQNRASLANELQPKLFISVHYNAAPNSKAEGIEVYYYKTDKDKTRTVASKQLGQHILKHVAKETKAKSRGVNHGNFAVIRETNMPAVLVEGGFLTNSTERDKLLDKKYLRKIASGIAQGVDDFLQKS